MINLSTDKDGVLREAFRVLRPGGRMVISDVVIRDAEPGEGPVPDAMRRNVELWTGCIAGSLEAQEYREQPAVAGFVDIAIQEVRRAPTPSAARTAVTRLRQLQEQERTRSQTGSSVHLSGRGNLPTEEIHARSGLRLRFNAHPLVHPHYSLTPFL
jgi:hypothetical protein